MTDIQIFLYRSANLARHYVSPPPPLFVIFSALVFTSPSIDFLYACEHTN